MMVAITIIIIFIIFIIMYVSHDEVQALRNSIENSRNTRK